MKLLLRTLFIALISTGMFYMPGVQSADQIYGSQLMTEQERIQHRETLRNMKTEEERERYRIEHHNKMQERAREKGLSLPDQPRNNGMNGGGPGMGSGKGGGR